MKTLRNLTASLLLCTLPHLAWAQACGNNNPGGSSGPGQKTTSTPNTPPQGPTPNPKKGDPVIIYTGNEYQEVVDLDVWGAVGSKPFNLTRWSNSRAVSGASVFGQGHYFRHNFQWELAATTADTTGRAQVIVAYPNGAQYTFTQIDPVVWRTTSSATDVLQATAEGLALVQADGSRCVFTATVVAGKPSTYVLTAMVDPYGLRTSLTYNAAKQLFRVTEPAGRTLTFAYVTRSVNAVDFSTLATVATAPAAGAWLELPVTSTTAYRYARLLSADLAFARFSEIEFYEAGTGARLTGTVLSSEAVALAQKALDGDPATTFVASAQSGAFVGYDFGTAKKIGRVRVLLQPGYEATAKPIAWGTSALRLQAANEKPATVTCLASVSTGDGRTVRYTYSDFTDETLPFRTAVLSSVDYGDGTQATYAYSQNYPSQRPLMVEFDLPRYELRQPKGRTVYQTSRSAVLGMVDKQVNIETGGTLLQVGIYNNTDLHQPTATYANGAMERQQMTNGLITAEIDRLGRKTTYTYDANGFIIKSTDALGRIHGYLVDTQGRILKTTYPDGTTQSQTYDDFGLPLVRTDALGRQTVTTRDSRHRITSIAHPDGTSEFWSYNDFNQPVTATSRDGSTETLSYDARGLLVSRTDAIGAVTRYTYDAMDRLATQTDALGRVTSFAYNPRGQLTGVTYPDGSSVVRAYDRYGNLVSTTDELGNVSLVTHDQFKRVIATTDALARTSTVEYPLDESVKAPLAVVSPGGVTQSFTYDLAWNELTRTVAPGTPEAATTRTAYDAVYRPISITDPLGHVTRQTYDLRDRVLTQTDALNRASTSAYDAAGRLTSQRRADGATTTHAYDAADRLVLTTDALGQATAHSYDAAGRLTVLTDPKGNRTTWSYDAAGRLTRKTYADGSAETYAYDLLGRRLSLTTPAGVTANYAYDQRDRLVDTDWSDATPDSTRVYDAAGRLVALTTSKVATHSCTYDAAGQLLSETTAPAALAPATFTVGYAYDLDGRRSQLTYPDGGVVTYDYTARGQLAALLADGPPPLATFAYDLAGRRTQKVLENGTTTTYSYDVADQLLTLVHTNPLQAELARFAYSYDLGGRRTAKTISGSAAQARAETYGYDAIDQVLSANYGASGSETFAYDPMGNRTSASLLGQGNVSYAINALNQYTAVNANAPAYDANGNTLSLAVPSTASSSTLNLAYDGQSRLTSARVLDPLTGLLTHTGNMVYDASNRQVSRMIDGVTTWFVWDGWSLLAEYQYNNGTLSQVARYVHGPRLDELIVQQKTVQPTPAYLHEDALGSTYLLTDASGSAVERYSYSAFGDVTAQDSIGAAVVIPSTRFLYTGREWIAQLGLNDHRNRFYLSSLGRWVNRDPIGEAGGINMYAYVLNSGTMYLDLLGLIRFSYKGSNENAAEFVNQANQSSTIMDIPPRDAVVPVNDGQTNVHTNGTVYFNHKQSGGNFDSVVVLAHEGKHAGDYLNDRKKYNHDKKSQDQLTEAEKSKFPNNLEKRAIDTENKYLDEKHGPGNGPRRDRWGSPENVIERIKELNGLENAVDRYGPDGGPKC
jgi:RHS repeat-associated protein